ncbi:hypothetical protein JX266_005293 [Neoarthrinium moseri]|nr:hypothetical protein JX266_005293 [Neoarthrinium moseri]
MFRNVALLALAEAIAALTFDGTGQIRALSSSSSADVGCLANDGSWTTSDTECGTFTGTREDDSTDFIISSTSGPCTLVDYATFECASGLEALTFWAWTGIVDDYDVLAYGETVTFSSPVEPSEELAPIRPYHTEDSKPWIHLGWAAL